ncbi:MAG: sulfite exporter TauE/SafE family protein [Rhizobacter sp.]|nr:sulfite exporter TauE/SafE family protein [Rhizobacter sp.]
METLVLLVAGALSGLIAGLVGLAGGIVVVPALTWLYGSSALHDAIVISWFAVLFNSVGAATKQYRIRTPDERRDIIKSCRYYVLGAVIVTPLVALVMNGARHLVTPALVAILQLCLAAVMLWPVAESTGERTTNKLLDFFFGGLIGGVSTLIGVGGGTYTIAYFVYAAKRKFQDAIATANMTGLIIGVLSVVGYLISLLYIDKTHPVQHASPISAAGMVILIVSGVVFSSIGVRLSRKLPTKVLRKILVVALMISAVRLLMASH